MMLVEKMTNMEMSLSVAAAWPSRQAAARAESTAAHKVMVGLGVEVLCLESKSGFH